MELTVLQSKIHEIRGVKVLLDFDLASLYEVENRILKQSVKRNEYRFPSDFMFQLSSTEWKELITKCDKLPQNSKYSPALPLAFTEQGVAMLSSVLKSRKAVETNIAVMRAFVEIRKMMTQRHELSQQFQELRKELEMRLGEQDTQIIEIYQALEELIDEKEERNQWENRKMLGY